MHESIDRGTKHKCHRRELSSVRSAAGTHHLKRNINIRQKKPLGYSPLSHFVTHHRPQTATVSYPEKKSPCFLFLTKMWGFHVSKCVRLGPKDWSTSFCCVSVSRRYGKGC